MQRKEGSGVELQICHYVPKSASSEGDAYFFELMMASYSREWAHSRGLATAWPP